jgi:hypothetical protein
MKIIDYLEQPRASKPQGALSLALGRAGSLISKDAKTQNILPEILGRTLDNKYFLLCNLSFPGLEIPVPYILIGPPGLWTIYSSPARGMYRAKENTWEELDETTRRYKPGKPNLLAVTTTVNKAVREYLFGHGIELASIEPMLFFSDPGVLVDAARPAVRVLLTDALERFAVNLVLNQATLDTTLVQKIVDTLSRKEQQVAAQPEINELRDAFSFRETPKQKLSLSLPSVNIPVPSEEPFFARKVPFNRRQWLILGALIFINLIILAVLVIIVLYSAV